jgi:putative sporulation protein YtaF
MILIENFYGGLIMVELFSIILLGFAVSFDSFSVGFTYGLRRILVPIKSLLVIMFCSGVMIFLSMEIGQLLTFAISPAFTKRIGAGILIVLGCGSLFNLFYNKDAKNSKDSQQYYQKKESVKVIKLWSIEFGNIFVAIQILKRPEIADIDKSGYISINEAMMLGLALAFDAFGTGIGAALIGYSTWISVSIISIMSGLFVYFGIKCGFIFAKVKNIEKLSYIPGFLLIIIGILKII